jgi:hypothetical protein
MDDSYKQPSTRFNALHPRCAFVLLRGKVCTHSRVACHVMHCEVVH